MIERTCRLVVLAVAAGVLATRAVAQQPVSSPPADSSRPPMLVRFPPESIHVKVAELHLYQLLGNLQRADATALDADLGEVEWGPSDQASRLLPQCVTLGAAISAAAGRLGARLPSAGGFAGVPIFFQRPRFADSAEATVVTADLIIVPPSGPKVTGTIRLSLDRVRMRWARVEGLLGMICGVATAGSR